MDPSKYPAAVAALLNIIMGVVVSFNFLSPTAAHVVATVVLAATSLLVAFLVHPFVLGAATGAFQTFLVALAGFGFHLTDQRIAALVAVFSLIAGVITHALGTPVVAHKQGTTVAELDRSAARRRSVASR
jgi:hypothetical protein